MEEVASIHQLQALTMPKKPFPQNITIAYNEKEYIGEALMPEWIHMVWNQQQRAHLRLPTILVFNEFRGHQTMSIKEVLRDAAAHLAVILGQPPPFSHCSEQAF